MTTHIAAGTDAVVSNTKRRISFDATSHQFLKRQNISTPLKYSNRDVHANANTTAAAIASSPFTPASSSIFQSGTRLSHELVSSPPMTMDNKDHSFANSNSAVRAPQGLFMNLSLNIGADGKACIGNFSPLKPKHDSLVQEQQENKENIVTVTISPKGKVPERKDDKNKILKLLKRMRNNTSNLTNQNQPTEETKQVKIEMTESRKSPQQHTIPSSPPVVPQLTITNSPAPPFTPRSTNFNLFRTGLTPNIPIDQVLLDNISLPKIFYDENENVSPHNNNNANDNTPQTDMRSRLLPLPQQQHFPFKFSGGDPLLINDDDQWAHNMASPNNNNPSNSGHVMKLMLSPRKPMTFGSPIIREPRTPRIQLDSLLNIDNDHNQDNANNHSKNDHTNNTTTTSNVSNNRRNSLEFTPLIQQTMNGALSAKIIPNMSISPPTQLIPILNNNNHTTANDNNIVSNNINGSEVSLRNNSTGSGPESMADDARAALKKLMNRN